MGNYVQNSDLDHQFVQLYLNEIGPLVMLSSSEEKELMQKTKGGNENAYNELILKSQYIVLEETLYFSERATSILDIIQYANLACASAIKRYEFRKGNLKNYLHRNIYRFLQNITADFYSVVRIPLNIVSEINKLCEELNQCERGISRELTQNDFHEILYDESVSSGINGLFEINDSYGELRIIPKRCEIDLDKISQNTFYLPDEILTKQSLEKELLRIINTLKKQERDIVKFYFGIEQENSQTLQEIGKKMNLTRERIRQLKESAISRLSHHSRSRPLRDCISLICPESICNASFATKNHLGLNNQDKQMSIELIEKYLEPQRRKTSYPNIRNIAETCRKIMTKILQERHEPCSYGLLKDLVYEKLPLLRPGSFDYALATCDNIVRIQDDLYALKEWDFFEAPIKRSKAKLKSAKNIRESMIEYLQKQNRPVPFASIIDKLKDDLCIERFTVKDEKLIYKLLLRTKNILRTYDIKFYYME